MVTPGLPPIPHVGGPVVGPGQPNVLIVSFITIIEGAIGIWALVIYVKVISEAQGLTIGMAVINLLLAFTIVGLFNSFIVIKWLES